MRASEEVPVILVANKVTLMTMMAMMMMMMTMMVPVIIVANTVFYWSIFYWLYQTR